MFENSSISLILRALCFAAGKHRIQHRKDGETPYINHLIDVAEVLWLEGNVRTLKLLLQAFCMIPWKTRKPFLKKFKLILVKKYWRGFRKVSDDKSLPKEERKQLQILRASSSSDGAKQIKIADKICNIRDLLRNPPTDWSLERIRQYLEWSNQVMAGLRGCNAQLESGYDETIKVVANEYGLQ